MNTPIQQKTSLVALVIIIFTFGISGLFLPAQTGFPDGAFVNISTRIDSLQAITAIDSLMIVDSVSHINWSDTDTIGADRTVSADTFQHQEYKAEYQLWTEYFIDTISIQTPNRPQFDRARLNITDRWPGMEITAVLKYENGKWIKKEWQPR